MRWSAEAHFRKSAPMISMQRVRGCGACGAQKQGQFAAPHEFQGESSGVISMINEPQAMTKSAAPTIRDVQARTLSILPAQCRHVAFRGPRSKPENSAVAACDSVRLVMDTCRIGIPSIIPSVHPEVSGAQHSCACSVDVRSGDNFTA